MHRRSHSVKHFRAPKTPWFCHKNFLPKPKFQKNFLLSARLTSWHTFSWPAQQIFASPSAKMQLETLWRLSGSTGRAALPVSQARKKYVSSSAELTRGNFTEILVLGGFFFDKIKNIFLINIFWTSGTHFKDEINRNVEKILNLRFE